MDNKIPIPTDNIYKFYALFGLLLVVFGIGSSIYVNTSTNNLAYEIAVEYQVLKENPVRSISEETQFQLLQRKLEIARKNKMVFLFGIGAIIGGGLLMMGYGFRKWHKDIQPIQDEIARLNLLKLKRELGEE